MGESRIVDRIASGVACGGDDSIAFRELMVAEIGARGALVERNGERCCDPAIFLELMDELAAAAAEKLSIATLFAEGTLADRERMRELITAYFSELRRGINEMRDEILSAEV